MTTNAPSAHLFSAARADLDRGIIAFAAANRQIRNVCLRLIRLYENQAETTKDGRLKQHAEELAEYYRTLYQSHGG